MILLIHREKTHVDFNSVVCVAGNFIFYGSTGLGWSAVVDWWIYLLSWGLSSSVLFSRRVKFAGCLVLSYIGLLCDWLGCCCVVVVMVSRHGFLSYMGLELTCKLLSLSWLCIKCTLPLCVGLSLIMTWESCGFWLGHDMFFLSWSLVGVSSWLVSLGTVHSRFSWN